MKPLLLDTFCKAGGAGVGYSRAGFDVVGVDIEPQPHYPFEFIQGDAIEFIRRRGGEFDMIHASPPCQAYSCTAPLSRGGYPMLVDETRAALIATGKPYVIENVPGAPLINPLVLCGSMFGLQVIRHRLFECSPVVWWPPMACNHEGGATGNRLRRAGITRTPTLSDGYKFITVVGNNFLGADGAKAMGIDWMNKRELAQAIPPAYTHWLGVQILQILRRGNIAHSQDTLDTV